LEGVRTGQQVLRLGSGMIEKLAGRKRLAPMPRGSARPIRTGTLGRPPRAATPRSATTTIRSVSATSIIRRCPKRSARLPAAIVATARATPSVPRKRPSSAALPPSSRSRNGSPTS
jgi:hypothetical protein